MTPKQEARDRKRIRAALARAGKILADLREEFDDRADPYSTDAPEYTEWFEQLSEMDCCLDHLDNLLAEFTVKSD